MRAQRDRHAIKMVQMPHFHDCHFSTQVEAHPLVPARSPPGPPPTRPISPPHGTRAHMALHAMSDSDDKEDQDDPDYDPQCDDPN